MSFKRCEDCGKEIFRSSERCRRCAGISRRKNNENSKKSKQRSEHRFECRYCGVMCTARQLVCAKCRTTVKGQVMRLSKLRRRGH